MSIRDDIQNCIRDTKRYLNGKTASLIEQGDWHASDDEAADFISTTIRKSVNVGKGRDIHDKSGGIGITLEAIALMPEHALFFSDDDRKNAKRNLGL